MDESEVVEFSSGREVGPSWPHEEVYIGQIRQEPAADEEGAHGCTARLGYSHIQDRQHHPCLSDSLCHHRGFGRRIKNELRHVSVKKNFTCSYCLTEL